MKQILIIILFLSNSFQFSWADIDRSWFMNDEDIDKMYGSAAETRGAATQHRSLEIIRKRIENFEKQNARQAIPALAESLRKLARKNIYQVKERIEVYDLAQAKLLATPGHARYFAEEVERLIADPDNAGTDVRERSWYLGDTLVHLPSPETIQVLGSYLYDERFTLDPAEDNSGAIGATYALAAVAIRHIGLRDFENTLETPDNRWNTPKDIEAIRGWWEEVKSGERAFSFKGQAVEYRFLPDGTWETIPMENPPDDDPRKVVAVAATPKQNDEPSPTQPPAPEARDMPQPWMWIGIAGALLALAIGWRMLRRKNRAHSGCGGPSG